MGHSQKIEMDFIQQVLGTHQTSAMAQQSMNHQTYDEQICHAYIQIVQIREHILNLKSKEKGESVIERFRRVSRYIITVTHDEIGSEKWDDYNNELWMVADDIMTDKDATKDDLRWMKNWAADCMMKWDCVARTWVAIDEDNGEEPVYEDYTDDEDEDEDEDEEEEYMDGAVLDADFIRGNK